MPIKPSTYINEIKYMPFAVRNILTGVKEGMEVQKIAYGLNSRQYMLHCKPHVQIKREHVICFVHGGGWYLGSPWRFLYMARQFCAQGYEVFMPTYRLLPRYQFPDLREDIFAAGKMIYDLCNDRFKSMIIVGPSAGGQLGGLLIYDRIRREQYGIPDSFFRGFISLSGALDLETFPETMVLRSYAGPRTGNKFVEANPINYVQPDWSPIVLLVHGTEDAIVPYDSSVSFFQTLKGLQLGPIHFHTEPGATHLHVNTSWPERSPKTREVILDWLETYGG